MTDYPMEDTSVSPAPSITRATPSDVDEILNVLARGMIGTPLHIAAYGTGAVERKRLLRQLFALRTGNATFMEHAVVARDSSQKILAMYGALPPGTCTPSVGDQLSMLPAILRMGVGNAFRTVGWFGAWGKYDFQEPHWHLGPFAVDADSQGQGIGSAMMSHFCQHMDAVDGVAYLETDKDINIRFYERFGFQMIDEIQVLGTTNWRMVRRPPAETAVER